MGHETQITQIHYRAVERFPAICLPGGLGPRSGFESNAMPEILSEKSECDSLLTINWALVKDSLSGGPEVMGEFLEVVKQETSTLVVDIRRAIETRDSKLLRRAAHTLKSSVAYFGAEPLVQAALALENLGRTELFDATSELFATLEREHACFLTALEVGPPKLICGSSPGANPIR